MESHSRTLFAQSVALSQEVLGRDLAGGKRTFEHVGGNLRPCNTGQILDAIEEGGDLDIVRPVEEALSRERKKYDRLVSEKRKEEDVEHDSSGADPDDSSPEDDLNETEAALEAAATADHDVTAAQAAPRPTKKEIMEAKKQLLFGRIEILTKMRSLFANEVLPTTVSFLKARCGAMLFDHFGCHGAEFAVWPEHDESNEVWVTLKKTQRYFGAAHARAVVLGVLDYTDNVLRDQRLIKVLAKQKTPSNKDFIQTGERFARQILAMALREVSGARYEAVAERVGNPKWTLMRERSRPEDRRAEVFEDKIGGLFRLEERRKTKRDDQAGEKQDEKEQLESSFRYSWKLFDGENRPSLVSLRPSDCGLNKKAGLLDVPALQLRRADVDEDAGPSSPRPSDEIGSGSSQSRSPRPSNASAVQAAFLLLLQDLPMPALPSRHDHLTSWKAWLSRIAGPVVGQPKPWPEAQHLLNQKESAMKKWVDAATEIAHFRPDWQEGSGPKRSDPVTSLDQFIAVPLPVKESADNETLFIGHVHALDAAHREIELLQLHWVTAHRLINHLEREREFPARAFAFAPGAANVNSYSGQVVGHFFG